MLANFSENFFLSSVRKVEPVSVILKMLCCSLSQNERNYYRSVGRTLCKDCSTEKRYNMRSYYSTGQFSCNFSMFPPFQLWKQQQEVGKYHCWCIFIHFFWRLQNLISKMKILQKSIIVNIIKSNCSKRWIELSSFQQLIHAMSLVFSTALHCTKISAHYNKDLRNSSNKTIKVALQNKSNELNGR